MGSNPDEALNFFLYGLNLQLSILNCDCHIFISPFESLTFHSYVTSDNLYLR